MHPLEIILSTPVPELGAAPATVLIRGRSALGGYESGFQLACQQGLDDVVLQETCELLTYLCKDPVYSPFLAADRVLEYLIGMIYWRKNEGGGANVEPRVQLALFNVLSCAAAQAERTRLLLSVCVQSEQAAYLGGQVDSEGLPQSALVASALRLLASSTAAAEHVFSVLPLDAHAKMFALACSPSETHSEDAASQVPPPLISLLAAVNAAVGFPGSCPANAGGLSSLVVSDLQRLPELSEASSSGGSSTSLPICVPWSLGSDTLTDTTGENSGLGGLHTLGGTTGPGRREGVLGLGLFVWDAVLPILRILWATVGRQGWGTVMVSALEEEAARNIVEPARETCLRSCEWADAWSSAAEALAYTRGWSGVSLPGGIGALPILLLQVTTGVCLAASSRSQGLGSIPASSLTGTYGTVGGSKHLPSLLRPRLSLLYAITPPVLKASRSKRRQRSPLDPQQPRLGQHQLHQQRRGSLGEESGKMSKSSSLSQISGSVHYARYQQQHQEQQGLQLEASSRSLKPPTHHCATVACGEIVISLAVPSDPRLPFAGPSYIPSCLASARLLRDSFLLLPQLRSTAWYEVPALVAVLRAQLWRALGVKGVGNSRGGGDSGGGGGGSGSGSVGSSDPTLPFISIANIFSVLCSDARGARGVTLGSASFAASTAASLTSSGALSVAVETCVQLHTWGQRYVRSKAMQQAMGGEGADVDGGGGLDGGGSFTSSQPGDSSGGGFLSSSFLYKPNKFAPAVLAYAMALRLIHLTLMCARIGGVGVTLSNSTNSTTNTSGGGADYSAPRPSANLPPPLHPAMYLLHPSGGVPAREGPSSTLIARQIFASALLHALETPCDAPPSIGLGISQGLRLFSAVGVAKELVLACVEGGALLMDQGRGRRMGQQPNPPPLVGVAEAASRNNASATKSALRVVASAWRGVGLNFYPLSPPPKTQVYSNNNNNNNNNSPFMDDAAMFGSGDGGGVSSFMGGGGVGAAKNPLSGGLRTLTYRVIAGLTVAMRSCIMSAVAAAPSPLHTRQQQQQQQQQQEEKMGASGGGNSNSSPPNPPSLSRYVLSLSTLQCSIEALTAAHTCPGVAGLYLATGGGVALAAALHSLLHLPTHTSASTSGGWSGGASVGATPETPAPTFLLYFRFKRDVDLAVLSLGEGVRRDCCEDAWWGRGLSGGGCPSSLQADGEVEEEEHDGEWLGCAHALGMVPPAPTTTTTKSMTPSPFSGLPPPSSLAVTQGKASLGPPLSLFRLLAQSSHATTADALFLVGTLRLALGSVGKGLALGEDISGFGALLSSAGEHELRKLAALVFDTRTASADSTGAAPPASTSTIAALNSSSPAAFTLAAAYQAVGLTEGATDVFFNPEGGSSNRTSNNSNSSRAPSSQRLGLLGGGDGLAGFNPVARREALQLVASSRHALARAAAAFWYLRASARAARGVSCPLESLGGRIVLIRGAFIEAMVDCLPSQTPWAPFTPKLAVHSGTAPARFLTVGPSPSEIYLDSCVEELSDPVMIALGEGDGLAGGGGGWVGRPGGTFLGGGLAGECAALLSRISFLPRKRVFKPMGRGEARGKRIEMIGYAVEELASGGPFSALESAAALPIPAAEAAMAGVIDMLAVCCRVLAAVWPEPSSLCGLGTRRSNLPTPYATVLSRSFLLYASFATTTGEILRSMTVGGEFSDSFAADTASHSGMGGGGGSILEAPGTETADVRALPSAVFWSRETLAAVLGAAKETATLPWAWTVSEQHLLSQHPPPSTQQPLQQLGEAATAQQSLPPLHTAESLTSTNLAAPMGAAILCDTLVGVCVSLPGATGDESGTGGTRSHVARALFTAGLLDVLSALCQGALGVLSVHTPAFAAATGDATTPHSSPTDSSPSPQSPNLILSGHLSSGAANVLGLVSRALARLASFSEGAVALTSQGATIHDLVASLPHLTLLASISSILPAAPHTSASAALRGVLAALLAATSRCCGVGVRGGAEMDSNTPTSSNPGWPSPTTFLTATMGVLYRNAPPLRNQYCLGEEAAAAAISLAHRTSTDATLSAALKVLHSATVATTTGVRDFCSSALEEENEWKRVEAAQRTGRGMPIHTSVNPVPVVATLGLPGLREILRDRHHSAAAGGGGGGDGNSTLQSGWERDTRWAVEEEEETWAWLKASTHTPSHLVFVIQRCTMLLEGRASQPSSLSLAIYSMGLATSLLESLTTSLSHEHRVKTAAMGAAASALPPGHASTTTTSAPSSSSSSDSGVGGGGGNSLETMSHRLLTLAGLKTGGPATAFTTPWAPGALARGLGTHTLALLTPSMVAALSLIRTSVKCIECAWEACAEAPAAGVGWPGSERHVWVPGHHLPALREAYALLAHEPSTISTLSFTLDVMDKCVGAIEAAAMSPGREFSVSGAPLLLCQLREAGLHTSARVLLVAGPLLSSPTYTAPTVLPRAALKILQRFSSAGSGKRALGGGGGGVDPLADSPILLWRALEVLTGYTEGLGIRGVREIINFGGGRVSGALLVSVLASLACGGEWNSSHTPFLRGWLAHHSGGGASSGVVIHWRSLTCTMASYVCRILGAILAAGAGNATARVSIEEEGESSTDVSGLGHHGLLKMKGPFPGAGGGGADGFSPPSSSSTSSSRLHLATLIESGRRSEGLQWLSAGLLASLHTLACEASGGSGELNPIIPLIGVERDGGGGGANLSLLSPISRLLDLLQPTIASLSLTGGGGVTNLAPIVSSAHVIAGWSALGLLKCGGALGLGGGGGRRPPLATPPPPPTAPPLHPYHPTAIPMPAPPHHPPHPHTPP